jgi:hypothetical protein
MRILPVQNPDSAYHVAALNNLYAGAVIPGFMSDGIPSIPAAATSAATPTAWDSRLEAALGELSTLAAEVDGQPEALLALLRRLEELHRTIQDGPFRASLPADRNQLFNLLQSMERSGGWPYIPRLQLRTFMDLMQSGDAGSALAA